MSESASELDRRKALFRALLGPDRAFIVLAITFGIASSLLTLAVPLSVQVLISSVANTALLRPVVVLALLLFGLLALYGLLYGLQTAVMDRFGRRFFARFAEEAVLRSLLNPVAAGRRLNREELANRFFEVVTVQRNLPQLVVTGSAVLLQALVGVVVVSAYHPLFLAFSAVLLLCAWLIWRLWAAAAIETKVAESKAKFRFAHWLEELARLHSSFQSERTIDYACQQAERLIGNYVSAHRRHFGFKLRQLVGYFALYALSSAALLGVGGGLVIASQLTLGQLVAAELIFSAVFASLIRLPWLLDLFYEMTAAVDKLGEFLALEPEDEAGEPVPHGPLGLRFERALIETAAGPVALDLRIAPGELLLMRADEDARLGAWVAVLRRQQGLASGSLFLGDVELGQLRLHALRDAVGVVDDGEAMARSLAEVLSRGTAGITPAAMREVLAELGLLAAVERLPEGLDSVLARSGDPFSAEQMIRLNVAAALLQQPRVLVLTTVADRLSQGCRQRIVDAMRRRPGLTFIQLSHRSDLVGFDRVIELGLAAPAAGDPP